MTPNCVKFLKRWENQITLLASWETCMQVKKQQLEPDMEQWTGSKIGKGVCQVYILSTCLFNLHVQCIMRNCRLDEAQAGIKIAGKNINNLRYAWHHPYGRKRRGTKESHDEGEWGKWISWLKTQHSKNEDHGIRPYHFMANRWVHNGNTDRLCFLGL